MSINLIFKSVAINQKQIAILAFCCFIAFSCVQKPQPMVVTSKDPLVKEFYTVNNENQFWFATGKNTKKALKWLEVIDSAHKYGLVADKKEIEKVRAVLSQHNNTDITLTAETDQQITALVLKFIKELQEGNVRFDYDEVCISRDSVYYDQLLNSQKGKSVTEYVDRLDCKDKDYVVLKKFLNDSISENDTLKYKSVLRAMNYRRYLTLNRQPEFIVVNIPEAVARYYKNDVESMKMNVVVGRKKTPTLTIASYIETIVTFPNWNVPRSIAVKEILPKMQQNENYLEQNNYDVVDSKGNVIDDSELNWKKYNQKNFPYFFRQATGSDNALGVLKFDFKNPFSIFLHSTSNQNAFSKEVRFLSHGCVRLEKPIELANEMLKGKLDMEELKAGKKDTKPKNIELPMKIPVFIIYSPLTVEGNKVTFLPDVYGLIK